MMLTIPYLMHCLSEYSPVQVQIGSPDITICAIRPYTLIPEYEKNVLYIDKSAQYPDIPPRNFIFIGDTDLPDKAQLCDYNLFILPPDIDLSSLMQKLCETMLSSNITEQFTTEMLSLLSRSERLKAIADVSYRYFQNPIIISDKNWKALAMAPDIDIENDPDWTSFRHNGTLSMEAVTGDLHDNLSKTLGISKSPFYWTGSRMAYPRLFSSITVGQRNIGTVSILEYNHKFTDQDYALLPYLSATASAEMQKTDNLSYARNLEYEEFFSDLLEGHITSPAIITGKMQAMDVSFKSFIYLYLVDVSSFNFRHFSQNFLRDYLEKMICGYAFVYRNNIVLLRSSNKHEGPSTATDIESITTLTDFLREHSARCGISRGFEDLSNIQLAYHQASVALEIANHMEGKYNPCIWYSQYSLFHIAKICDDNDDLLSMCHPSLFVLIKYDKEHNTSLTQTLHVYLNQSRNISLAANALHLHRNSMIYRLTKIEEITGMSLSNPDSLLHFELSFYFLHYTNKYLDLSDLGI